MMSGAGKSIAAGRPDGRMEPARVGLRGRLTAVAVAAGCLAVLGLAAWVRPAAAGHGTHEALGLPRCHWAQLFDKPCMTCGMTTAFAHAARGDLVHSALAQPAGFVLAIATAATAWGAGLVAATGSTLGRAAARMLNARLLWVSLVILLAAWAYKFVTWQG